MTNNTLIWVCPNPLQPRWELGPLPPSTGHMTLLGWEQTPESVDGGIPKDAARVVARALTSLARVTFPCSRMKSMAAEDEMRRLDPPSVWERLMARWKGFSAEILVVSTRSPETLMSAFKDSGYPWWLKGQVLLISDANKPMPEIDRRTLLALINPKGVQQIETLSAVGVEGILRPGVDGDVAGLLSFNEVFEQRVLAALESESRRAGLEWGVRSEDQTESSPG